MTNTNGKLSDSKQRALEVVKGADEPVDVQQVADDLNVAWATARALLLQLLVDKKIRGMHTGHGWLFFVPRKLQEVVA